MKTLENPMVFLPVPSLGASQSVPELRARAAHAAILVVTTSAQFEVRHSERDKSFFTLSSRLFPSLLILLVRLYLHHNYLIATTCLPQFGDVFWGLL